MPIEGPLRELGLQEVFQLLDLSRKTGVLHVTNRMKDDEGHVWFERGRVIQANVKSKAVAPVDVRALSDRELERRNRGRVELAIYDLMAWREGFFRFEERETADIAADRRVTIPTESLLMESARRIDEWGRIADKIPNLKVVPVLADAGTEHESQLDLLPHEWEVLSLIDGQRDLRAIADLHGRDHFETAKVVYGLITTGVVEVRPQRRVSVAAASPSGGAPTLPLTPRPAENPEIMGLLDAGFAAARTGDFVAARLHWERFLTLAPVHQSAARVRAALEAAITLRAAIDAHDRGQRA
jgi:hypothetical protein